DGGKIIEERRERMGQSKDDRPRVWRLDCADDGEDRYPRRACRGIDKTFECELDVVAGENVAVVEFDALTQMEDEGQRIRVLPCDGKIGLETACRRIPPEQARVDVFYDIAGRKRRRLVRIEPDRILILADRQQATALRRRRFVRCERRPGAVSEGYEPRTGGAYELPSRNAGEHVSLHRSERYSALRTFAQGVGDPRMRPSAGRRDADRCTSLRRRRDADPRRRTPAASR